MGYEQPFELVSVDVDAVRGLVGLRQVFGGFVQPAKQAGLAGFGCPDNEHLCFVEVVDFVGGFRAVNLGEVVQDRRATGGNDFGRRHADVVVDQMETSAIVLGGDVQSAFEEGGERGQGGDLVTGQVEVGELGEVLEVDDSGGADPVELEVEVGELGESGDLRTQPLA